MFLLVILLSFGASALVRQWLKRTYAKWSVVPNDAQLDGHSVARRILDHNQLQQVRLEISKGILTDHYMPSRKLIRLSRDINDAPSVASLAVAAHEVGHAIQDKEGYGPLKFKAMLMPLAAIGNQLGLMMTLGSAMFGIPSLLNTGILMMLLGMLMPLLTLPIEFDASKRALHELTDLNLVNQEEYLGAKQVLRAAAFTYVAGAASSAAIVALIMLRFIKR